MRTLKLALESRLGVKLPVRHPVMFWLIEHCAAIVTKYHVGSDGTTGYAQLHGRECTEKLVEFGERIMFYVPRKIRAKLDPRWRYGIWLGRAINADESYIATSDGRVTRARAIVRLIETARWDATKILAVKGKPGDKFVDGLEKIEEDKQPHLGLDEEPPEGEDPHTKARMRMRITLRDLEKYGFTKGCARCNMHQLGKTSGVNHNEECRLRIYQAMTDASDSKLKKAKNLGLDEKELREPQLKEDPSPEPTTFEPIEEKNPVKSAGEPDKDDQGTFDEVFDEMFCDDNDDNLITDDGDTPNIETDNIDDSDMGEHDEYDAMVSVLQTLGVNVLQAVAYTFDCTESILKHENVKK